MKYSILQTTVALFALAGLMSQAQTIPNPSFEADTYSVAPGYCSQNGNNLTGWTLEAGEYFGLNPAGGTAFFCDNGLPPQGVNVAFLQTLSGECGISTTITGLTPGSKYALTCRVNARAGIPPNTFATPTMWFGPAGQYENFVVPAVAPAGVYTTPYRLATSTFIATRPSVGLYVWSFTTSDGALLVDDVRISALPASLWSVSAWTNDGSTGVDTNTTLRAYRFGSAGDVSINGVVFTGIKAVWL